MTTTIQPISRHILNVPFDGIEFRKAQNGRSDNYTLRGHAAVFDSLSEDLGGFREQLARGAFRAALRGTPDVRLLFNHDSNRVLARSTASVDGKPSLELREDATGLHVWAVIQPRTWVNDLAIEMAGGLIDQMSFAFSLRDGGDNWEERDDGIVRTILPDGIESLYDVSVVTTPAYVDTSVGIRELRHAVAMGRLPESVLGESRDVTAPDDLVAGEDQTAPHDDPVVAEEPYVADGPTAAERGKALRAARERHLVAMKELLK